MPKKPRLSLEPGELMRLQLLLSFVLSRHSGQSPRHTDWQHRMHHWILADARGGAGRSHRLIQYGCEYGPTTIWVSHEPGRAQQLLGLASGSTRINAHRHSANAGEPLSKAWVSTALSSHACPGPRCW